MHERFNSRDMLLARSATASFSNFLVQFDSPHAEYIVVQPHIHIRNPSLAELYVAHNNYAYPCINEFSVSVKALNRLSSSI